MKVKECTLCSQKINTNDWKKHTAGAEHIENEKQLERDVLVAGFPPDTKDSVFVEHFSKFGVIQHLLIDSNLDKCILVHFKSPYTAKAVLFKKHLLGRHELSLVSRHPALLQTPFYSKDLSWTEYLLNFLVSQPWLTLQLELIRDEVRLTKDDQRRRQVFCKLLEQKFQEFVPSCRLTVFGPSVNGLGTKACDLDLSLDLNVPTGEMKPSMDMEWIVENLGSVQTAEDKSDFVALVGSLSTAEVVVVLAFILQQHAPGCLNVFTQTTAQCPAVCFYSKGLQINCEITINNRFAIQNTSLIRFYTTLDDRFQFLYFLLHFWMTYNNLLNGNGQEGRLSKYALTMIVVFYLQTCKPPILPTLQTLMDLEPGDDQTPSDNWECRFCTDATKLRLQPHTTRMGRLLSNFFIYYDSLKPVDTVLCMRTGEVKRKAEFTSEILQHQDSSKYAAFQMSPFAIQDPFELNRNVTANVTVDALCGWVTAVKESCQRASSRRFQMKGEAEHVWGFPHLLAGWVKSAYPNEVQRSVGETWSPFDVPIRFEMGQCCGYVSSSDPEQDQAHVASCTQKICNVLREVFTQGYGFLLQEVRDGDEELEDGKGSAREPGGPPPRGRVGKKRRRLDKPSVDLLFLSSGKLDAYTIQTCHPVWWNRAAGRELLEDSTLPPLEAEGAVSDILKTMHRPFALEVPMCQCLCTLLPLAEPTHIGVSLTVVPLRLPGRNDWRRAFHEWFENDVPNLMRWLVTGEIPNAPVVPQPHVSPLRGTEISNANIVEEQRVAGQVLNTDVLAQPPVPHLSCTGIPNANVVEEQRVAGQIPNTGVQAQPLVPHLSCTGISNAGVVTQPHGPCLSCTGIPNAGILAQPPVFRLSCTGISNGNVEEQRVPGQLSNTGVMAQPHVPHLSCTRMSNTDSVAQPLVPRLSCTGIPNANVVEEQRGAGQIPNVGVVAQPLVPRLSCTGIPNANVVEEQRVAGQIPNSGVMAQPLVPRLSCTGILNANVVEEQRVAGQNAGVVTQPHCPSLSYTGIPNAGSMAQPLVPRLSCTGIPNAGVVPQPLVPRLSSPTICNANVEEQRVAGQIPNAGVVTQPLGSRLSCTGIPNPNVVQEQRVTGQIPNAGVVTHPHVPSLSYARIPNPNVVQEQRVTGQIPNADVVTHPHVPSLSYARIPNAGSMAQPLVPRLRYTGIPSGNVDEQRVAGQIPNAGIVAQPPVPSLSCTGISDVGSMAQPLVPSLRYAGIPSGNVDEQRVAGQISNAGSMAQPLVPRLRYTGMPSGNVDEQRVSGQISNAGSMAQPLVPCLRYTRMPSGNVDEQRVAGQIPNAGVVTQPHALRLSCTGISNAGVVAQPLVPRLRYTGIPNGNVDEQRIAGQISNAGVVDEQQIAGQIPNAGVMAQPLFPRLSCTGFSNAGVVAQPPVPRLRYTGIPNGNVVDEQRVAGQMSNTGVVAHPLVPRPRYTGIPNGNVVDEQRVAGQIFNPGVVTQPHFPYLRCTGIPNANIMQEQRLAGQIPNAGVVTQPHLPRLSYTEIANANVAERSRVPGLSYPAISNAGVVQQSVVPGLNCSEIPQFFMDPEIPQLFMDQEIPQLFMDPEIRQLFMDPEIPQLFADWMASPGML